MHQNSWSILQTGIVATPSVQDRMIGAFNKGMAMAENFVSEGEEKPQKSFNAMKRANVKIMSDIEKMN